MLHCMPAIKREARFCFFAMCCSSWGLPLCGLPLGAAAASGRLCALCTWAAAPKRCSTAAPSYASILLRECG